MTIDLMARFWGLLTLTMAAIYFLRPSVLVQVKTLMVENRAFALMYGIVSIILGLVSIVLWNEWARWLPALISLFGWMCLLKGIMVLIYPEVSYRTPFKTRMATTRISLAIACLLGGVMVYASYH